MHFQSEMHQLLKLYIKVKADLYKQSQILGFIISVFAAVSESLGLNLF